MKKILMTLVAVLCCTMTTSVLTSCSIEDNPSPVSDNKPFPCDDAMDYSVRPGDDFYRYVNGLWLDSSDPSPSMFKQVETESQKAFENMLATSPDPLMVKMRSQAAADMNDDSKNKAIVNERLQMIEKVTTADQLYATFGTLQDLGYSPLLRLIPIPAVGRVNSNLIVTGGSGDDSSDGSLAHYELLDKGTWGSTFADTYQLTTFDKLVGWSRWLLLNQAAPPAWSPSSFNFKLPHDDMSDIPTI